LIANFCFALPSAVKTMPLTVRAPVTITGTAVDFVETCPGG
jgi:hypothetical protein